MEKHLLVVLTKPVEGRDAEYRRWWSTDHFEHVLRLDGFSAVQGFGAEPSTPGLTAPYQYLGLYEVPDGKLQAAQAALAYQRAEREHALARGRRPLAPRTDTLHEDRISWWVTAITDRRVAASVDGIKPRPLE
jgi:hypothetical protein